MALGLSARDVVTDGAVRNAMAAYAAVGGSTNFLLHLPAIAHAAGLRPPALAEWKSVNARVPRLVDALPNGPHPTVRVFLAGGVPEVFLHLRGDTVELDDQDRAGVRRVAGVDSRLGRLDRQPVHHLDRRRQDARGNDVRAQRSYRQDPTACCDHLVIRHFCSGVKNLNAFELCRLIQAENRFPGFLCRGDDRETPFPICSLAERTGAGSPSMFPEPVSMSS